LSVLHISVGAAPLQLDRNGPAFGQRAKSEMKVRAALARMPITAIDLRYAVPAVREQNDGSSADRWPARRKDLGASGQLHDPYHWL
jgi:hypothetical protein